MALYVIAIQTKYGNYTSFRILDTITKEVVDMPALCLYQRMTNGRLPLNIKHFKLDFARNSFKFVNCDDSRLCLLDDNFEPITNTDGMIITDIDGDYVYMANYTGQLIRVHMLQVKNAVDKKRAVLVNATIQSNGRIKINGE